MDAVDGSQHRPEHAGVLRLRWEKRLRGIAVAASDHTLREYMGSREQQVRQAECHTGHRLDSMADKRVQHHDCHKRWGIAANVERFHFHTSVERPQNLPAEIIPEAHLDRQPFACSHSPPHDHNPLEEMAQKHRCSSFPIVSNDVCINERGREKGEEKILKKRKRKKGNETKIECVARRRRWRETRSTRRARVNLWRRERLYKIQMEEERKKNQLLRK